MGPDKLDVLWVVLSAALVFMMQAGFLCLEAGLTRTKNSINVALKNLSDFGLSMFLFWVVGFGMMFGASAGGWIGVNYFFPDVGGGPAWDATFFLFQAMFCGTAVTIISGAVAERIRFGAYMLIASMVSILIYPVFGHWAWGGALLGEEGGYGWLTSLGFVDFAGSTVVHSVGGWVSLAAILLIGPRFQRFDSNANQSMSGSNLPLAMLGTLLLWFGWVGFNGGSTLALNDAVPGIIANTMLAACGGLIVALFISRTFMGYPSAGAAINGSLAGLVAITANCHAVTALSAVIIGGVGAAIAMGCGWLIAKAKIDDVIGAVPVHLAAGAWGTLAVALFGDPERLGTGLTMLGQLKVQALGVAACGALCMGVSFPLLWVVNLFKPLRVSLEDEKIGLNVAEHRASNDLLDLARTIDRQSRTGDLTTRAHVEPFTEAGQIAERYNALMDLLQQSKGDITELRQTEAALREAIEEAEHANRAKSEFLANMSHEIRTPLHGILSFAGFGLKKARKTEPEKVEEYFRKIDISGRRLLLLVNDLLDLAKLEAGKMQFEFEHGDLVEVVEAVVDEFSSLLSEKGMRVEFEAPDCPINAQIDVNRMMQVVRNLVNNAIKFSPAKQAVRVSLSRDDTHVSLSVRDFGNGIPEDELEMIFDKFIQSSKTKSGAGGTGLGLSICQEIVRGHQGAIRAANHPEGGAVFTVTFPIRRETMPMPEDRDPAYNVELDEPSCDSSTDPVAVCEEA